MYNDKVERELCKFKFKTNSTSLILIEHRQFCGLNCLKNTTDMMFPIQIYYLLNGLIACFYFVISVIVDILTYRKYFTPFKMWKSFVKNCDKRAYLY